MSWTDERIDSLKKLWAEGLSATQVAKQLGGVSRSAVCGKVKRLNLAKRDGDTNRRNRQRSKKSNGKDHSRATTVKSSESNVITFPQATAEETTGRYHLQPTGDVVVPISKKLQLVQLTEQSCKWPHGQPWDEDFSFCGADSMPKGPYCTYHARIAFQPLAERRRSR